MDERNRADIQEYLIILHENQLAIKHLTQTVDRLTSHVDKMVEKQYEMNVVKSDMNVCDSRIAKLENNQARTVWGVLSGFGTIITAMAVYFLKGGQ